MAANNSKKAVLYAIVVNAIITALKFLAAFATHSAAMMNEAVHSLMDTINQIFLLMGLTRGGRPADQEYAFGHGQKKYMWNLWSAIGLFSIGSGWGLAHAWHVYHKLELVERPASVAFAGIELNPIWVSVVVLLIAFVLEGYVLYIAGSELHARMRKEGGSNIVKYLFSADDPTLVAVVLEDTIAVTGVLLAATGIGLTYITDNPMWDIGFSVVIALMLGLAAFFLGKVNMRFLTDVRDPAAEQAFRDVVSGHHEVEAYHDLRSVIIDENHTVVVAEIEMREEAMMGDLRVRIKRHEQALRQSVPDKRRQQKDLEHYITSRAVVQATLERTEEVIDELEAELRQKCPQVSHLTVEVQGIAEEPV
ncbi:MAG: cation diffusion facilitator family transporter [Proteobacteria bacterium]|nr:cation diffusion facilitator family transporter [Pseudomonadota bacterium]